MKLFTAICLLFFTLPLGAQQDPQFVLSASRGLALTSSQTFYVNPNVSVYGGCRIWSHLMAIGYFDYSRYIYSPETYGMKLNMRSGLIGLKASLPITGKRVMPYGIAAIGISNFTGTSDSVRFYSNHGLINILYNPRTGNTTSYVLAVGADVFIYRSIGLAGELRTSFGSDQHL